MGFFNKIQNLSFPLIKFRQDCVSSYYVLFLCFSSDFKQFYISDGVRFHRYFPHGENPAATRNLCIKKKLILFEHILEFKYYR